MKKFTLITLLVFIASLGFAQRNVDFSQLKRMPIKQNVLKKAKGVSRTAATTTMSKAPRKAASLVEPPQGKEATPWYILGGTCMAFTSNGEVDVTFENDYLKVLVDGSDIYIQGIDSWFPEGWVKGTISGSKVTIPSGQLVGSDDFGDEYLVGYLIETETICDIVFTYDSEAGVLTLDPTIFILFNGETDKAYAYGYWSELSLGRDAPELVTPPAGEEEDWGVLGAMIDFDEEGNTVSGEPEQYPVKVIKDGSDFYVQGLCKDFPEAWVKGTIADGKVSFATGQYLGVYTETDEESGEEYQFDMFLLGVSEESWEIDDLVFTYDEENNILTNKTSLMVVSYKPNYLMYYLYVYRPKQISKSVEEGISTINTKTKANVFYNLQGAKMNRPTQKGLYIVNGKKVVVK